MKIKRLISLVAMFVLSLALMACPSIKNSPPELVQLVDGEILPINEIVYNHTSGEPFDPDIMVQSLVEDQNLIAIDYDQSGVALGRDRDYFDISDRIEAVSFYDIWLDGEDANDDGVVDEADEEYYGQTKMDDDGNPIYYDLYLFLVEFASVDEEFSFTLKVFDDEGDFTTLSGNILIVE